jgi:hypothetical protein
MEDEAAPSSIENAEGIYEAAIRLSAVDALRNF